MRLLPEPAPPLPRFTSLLVHGRYPPSAPIHLSLSADRAILFTPSRQRLLHALSDDPWLNTHSGTGAVAGMSSGVTVFYPHSPQELIAVLGALRTHDPSSPLVPVAPKVTLDRTPSLLVLHELSSYFPPEQGEHTVSSYLLLITHALSTVEFLSSQSTNASPASLVVFDGRLDDLKLPVLRMPLQSTFDKPEGPEDVPRPEPVLFFVEKYLELSGTFQSHESDPSAPVFAWRRIGS